MPRSSANLQVQTSKRQSCGLCVSRIALCGSRPLPCASRRFTAILANNHLNGNPDPSNADKVLTHQLKAVMALVEVRRLGRITVA
ncbi:TPA: hypothetical protein VDW49_002867 [Pseudomonas aeruginosa]|nr:hypothetical protein [Pseudomonas aeruginosa]